MHLTDPPGLTGFAAECRIFNFFFLVFWPQKARIWSTGIPNNQCAASSPSAVPEGRKELRDPHSWGVLSFWSVRIWTPNLLWTRHFHLPCGDSSETGEGEGEGRAPAVQQNHSRAHWVPATGNWVFQGIPGDSQSWAEALGFGGISPGVPCWQQGGPFPLAWLSPWKPQSRSPSLPWGGHTPKNPTLEPGLAQSQGKLNHSRLISFFWLVGFGFLGGNSCFPELPPVGRGRLRVLRRLVVVDAPNPWLLCSPFPCLPSSCTWNFTPRWRIFPQNQGQGGCPHHGHGLATAPNPTPRALPAPAEPLSVSPSAPAPCPGSLGWIPWINRDGRACWTSFLVETTQNCAALGLQKQLDGSRASRFHRHRSQGWAGLISATELKKKKKKVNKFNLKLKKKKRP